MRMIDKKVLEAMELVVDYCDMTDLCDDCVFHDKTNDECSIRQSLWHSNFKNRLEALKEVIKWKEANT